MSTTKLPMIVAISVSVLILAAYFSGNKQADQPTLTTGPAKQTEIIQASTTNKTAEPKTTTQNKTLSIANSVEEQQQQTTVDKTEQATIHHNLNELSSKEGSVMHFAKIEDDYLWLEKIAQGSDQDSLERQSQITQYIYDDETLAQVNAQVECGAKLCALLFQDIDSEEDSNQVVEIMQKLPNKGAFMHHFTKQQDNGLYKTRVMIAKSENMDLVNIMLPEIKLE